ncbi:MAG: 3-deoxy-8-phosphooctulonate synthase [Polyangiaceae bacterium]|nr:3-deoxy-8-phosphooctulonate synthase [Polyangiaceae bacterium]
MLLLGHEVDNHLPLFLIAGPCVVEPGTRTLEVAAELREITTRAGVFFIFKASFDKANRSSGRSYRGPGFEEGLGILEAVKQRLGVPVLTDVHERTPVDEVAAVVDVLQTPAFLARQTDFIRLVAQAGRPLNVKKAQFMAPWDMHNVVEKCREVGNDRVLVCERGVSFGYNNLVADMRSLAQLRRTGCPVVFDATHSVQAPGGLGNASGGDRAMAAVLARAAVAVGIAGIFVETHPDPRSAPSDGATMWPLGRMRELLDVLVEIDRVVKKAPFSELSVH